MGLRSHQLISSIPTITRNLLGNTRRTTSGGFSFSATGGTISTPGDGYTYHTFTSPGSFIIQSGSSNLDMVVIGGGGGGGGFDPPPAGGGGGGGGAVLGRIALSGPLTLTVSVGGGGGGGGSDAVGTGGGPAGTNGGGTGGAAGGSGSSGGGGGGGGWSGVSNGPIYYVVGGGGAGGGGSNEGSANDIPALGGGSPSNTYTPSTLTGQNGTNFPGDGGGYGGSGGGFDGTSGGGGSGGTSQSGGSNYANPSLITSSIYAGGNGAAPANSTAGEGAPGFLPANTPWAPVVPTAAGDGGAGDVNNGGTGASGQPGIVVIRYLV